MSSARVLLAIAGGLLVSACADSKTAADIATAVEARLAESVPISSDKAVDDAARRFYAAREFASAWIGPDGAGRARRAIEFLGQASSHGLNFASDDRLGLQSELGLLEAQRRIDPAQAAEFDVHLTVAVLQLGRTIAIGGTSPTSVDKRWKARRDVPDLASTLADADGDLDAWIARVQPQHREYEQLRQALLQTMASPNLSDEERAVHRRRIALNMERWRWMPDDFGARHIFVNIPAYELRVREHGEDTLQMRVVVGKRGGNETPVFSGDMQTVVFSPAWNVPERIAREETLPAVIKDASYLTRQQLDVFRRTPRGLTPVDPDDVDWNDSDEVRNLTFRQRPGESNALGNVKFLFPNPFDVYLHDTPNDTVFARASRALSHGCVRVSEPATLAQYVLRDRPEWDPASIAAAMQAGRERHVKLAQSIPVHLAYFTASVDEAGEVSFLNDVYGYDARQSELDEQKREN